MAFRLRVLHQEVELGTGELVIGRSPEAQLVLDDPLVSRFHAALTVEGGRVRLRDLQSRNGVLVNGVRQRDVDLQEGDRIVVGMHELLLVGGEARVEERSGLPGVVEASPGPAAGSAKPTVQMPAPTRSASAVTLLFGVADKAVAAGHLEDAERILMTLLTDFRSQLALGIQPETERLEKAVAYGLRFASSTGKTFWLDWIFDVHRLGSRVLPAPVIDELHAVVRKTRYHATVALREYVEAMKLRAPAMGPAERFLVQRLEGLLEVAAAN